MPQDIGLKISANDYLLNIPGRARIRLEALRGDMEACRLITEHVLRIKGIILASANHYTAKILIAFNEAEISINEIEDILNRFFIKKTKSNVPGPVNIQKEAKVIKANFRFNKALAPDQFAKCKNSLSKEFYDFNIKALYETFGGAVPENLWHTLSVEVTEEKLETDIVYGLAFSEAEKKFLKYGPNELKKRKRRFWLDVVFKQFNGFIIKLLLGAAGLSVLIGQFVDAATILAIIGIEAALGAWQEYKSDKCLNFLRESSANTANVIRNGIKTEIPSENIVPGDIITIEAGDVVPADARLIESHGLELVEASLTGETFPIYKKNVIIPYGKLPLGDRTNMVYMGTSVAKGNGKAIVVATGMSTEIGKIADRLGDTGLEKTPLQKDLHSLSKFITWCCLGICATITIGGILGGSPFIEMFATGVSLAVGAIPEGLTTILAISLSFSAQRMVKKNAVIKSLPKLETLSCTKVICTDKTGTLTLNEMTVKELYTLNNTFEVSGEGYNTDGHFLINGETVDFKALEDIKMLITSSALCNNSELIPNGKNNFKIKGDPTEAALLIAMRKSGIELKEFQCYKREHEIPFDTEKMKMTAICSDENGNGFIFSKGAIDSIIKKCTKIFCGDINTRLSDEKREQILRANEIMADKALRVLAFSYKPTDTIAPDDPSLEEDMIFLGLIGIMDPPRAEVGGAIKKCRNAGIKVVMITGDHRNTAVAVAKNIGLMETGGLVLTGEDIDRMDEDELAEVIEKVDVFARTCPEQKLKIVKAFKKKGLIVAMTGDGINDAPALKEANIGIAMGKKGSDVSKDAADIILTDDNFLAVLKAVEEGRTINRNIKKFIKYVLSGNFAEVLVIFIAAVLGIPAPLIPSQILMLNLVTEGIPALSLGLDPPEKNIMEEAPRNPNDSILNRKLKNRIITRGIATGLTTLSIFGGTLLFGGSIIKARTMAFTNLVACQMLHAFECSSMGIRRNKSLLPSVLISFGIALSCIYIPALSGIFGLTPLNLFNWMAIGVSTIVISRFDDFIKDILYLARINSKPSFGV